MLVLLLGRAYNAVLLFLKLLLQLATRLLRPLWMHPSSLLLSLRSPCRLLLLLHVLDCLKVNSLLLISVVLQLLLFLDKLLLLIQMLRMSVLVTFIRRHNVSVIRIDKEIAWFSGAAGLRYVDCAAIRAIIHPCHLRLVQLFYKVSVL